MKLKDYEYGLCKQLHKRLKELVKGKVYTTVDNDVLYIEISYKDLKFSMAFEDLSVRFHQYDWTTADFVFAVINEYKKFINDRYFYD